MRPVRGCHVLFVVLLLFVVVICWCLLLLLLLLLCSACSPSITGCMCRVSGRGGEGEGRRREGISTPRRLHLHSVRLLTHSITHSLTHSHPSLPTLHTPPCVRICMCMHSTTHCARITKLQPHLVLISVMLTPVHCRVVSNRHRRDDCVVCCAASFIFILWERNERALSFLSFSFANVRFL